MSEGLDFSDDYARLTCIVGIPYVSVNIDELISASQILCKYVLVEISKKFLIILLLYSSQF